MRGSALLQRAYDYRMRYRDVVSIAEEMLPKMEVFSLLLFFLPLPNPAVPRSESVFLAQAAMGAILQIGTM